VSQLLAPLRVIWTQERLSTREPATQSAEELMIRRNL
jgi:hypothetical protein